MRRQDYRQKLGLCITQLQDEIQGRCSIVIRCVMSPTRPQTKKLNWVHSCFTANAAWRAAFSIGQVGGNGELICVADRHQLKPFDPSAGVIDAHHVRGSRPILADGTLNDAILQSARCHRDVFFQGVGVRGTEQRTC